MASKRKDGDGERKRIREEQAREALRDGKLLPAYRRGVVEASTSRDSCTRADIEYLYRCLGAEVGELDQDGMSIKLVAEAEFVGLCANPAVKDADLEWFVAKALEGDISPSFRESLIVYVRRRQPGEWFWDWWREGMREQTKVEGARADLGGCWQMFETYMAKDGVQEADLVAAVNEYKLYYIAGVYVQSWVNAKMAREWLAQSHKDLNRAIIGKHYNMAVLLRVYQMDAGKASEIVDGAIIRDLLRIATVYKWFELLVWKVFNSKSDDEIMAALDATHSVVWRRAFALVLPNFFDRLRPAVQERILRVAPGDVKARICAGRRAQMEDASEADDGISRGVVYGGSGRR